MLYDIPSRSAVAAGSGPPGARVLIWDFQQNIIMRAYNPITSHLRIEENDLKTYRSFGGIKIPAFLEDQKIAQQCLLSFKKERFNGSIQWLATARRSHETALLAPILVINLDYHDAKKIEAIFAPPFKQLLQNAAVKSEHLTQRKIFTFLQFKINY